MKCLIIAGSPEFDAELIKEQSNGADLIICADRGYSHAKKSGVTPDIVIGDFDSCEDEISGSFEVVRLNTDKDFTDTLVCADKAIERGCDEIIILSATGGRLDHTLANLYLLSYISDKCEKALIVSKKERIELLSSGKNAFSGLNGLTFSLFPFGCDSVTLSVKGAEYELEGYRLKSSLPVGVSNVFSSDYCEIEVSGGSALIIINYEI